MTSSGSSQSAKVGSDTWSASDSGLSSGTIGLHTYLADVYYDDVKVRKLVSTEPTIVVGAEASRPVGDQYYYAGSQRIGLRSGGTLSYIFSDHLGGTSVTLNASSGVTSTVTYFPFGSTRAGSVPTDYGFTGQRNDSSSGLMDYGARRYDPSLGRFISPDAIVSSLNNPQDFNRYSYAENNPTRFIDPSGHRGVDIGRLWRMLDFGGGGGGSGGGGKLPKVPAGTSAQPIKVKPMTVDSVREAGKGSESTAGGAPGRGSTRSTADPIAEPLGQGSGRGGPAEKAPVETGSGGKAKSIEAMRKANEEHADFYERWRSEKPEFRETNRTIKDPVTRKTILDEDGNYDGRRFDGVDYRTGEVAEFKTGQRTRQSSDAAWKQAEEYANTLNDVYGYEDFFWARVYWSDEE
ncbi:MAG: RHS repeat-associated core domain-containing protein [Chloroflexi bacterium]|nr:RHS repeat-associated core domain-containing protein [Chloroflexota bacterium]